MNKTLFSKRILSCGIAACVALSVQTAMAQITLNQASYASWTPGADTNRSVTGATANIANNGNWDHKTICLR